MTDNEAQIEKMDEIRHAVHRALTGEFDNLALDLIFTRDPRWIAVAVGGGVVSSDDSS